MLPSLKPLWLICEDGTEYLERFERFLGGAFRFARAGDAASLLSLWQQHQAEVRGVLLDLDFQRTPRERLIDDTGGGAASLPSERQRQLAARQGIYILRWLRAQGVGARVLLCADLDDPEQAAYLTAHLAPLAIVPGHESLLVTAERLKGT